MLPFNGLEAFGEDSDARFDSLLPDGLRKTVSSLHWTPVQVARRAAELLVTTPHSRILDVGSGVGKFCVVGALSTAGRFYGIEQRAHLTDVASQIAKKLGVANRTEFMSEDLRKLDWSLFDGFYLYNPFIENLYPAGNRIDAQSEFSAKNYVELIQWVQQRLHTLPLQTRIVTYHGFGGEMPPGYKLMHEEPADVDFIRLWVKVC